MTINENGEVVDHEIAETVIRVDERMSYTSVAKILEEQEASILDGGESSKYKELVPMFLLMAELSGVLREKREKAGGLLTLISRRQR